MIYLFIDADSVFCKDYVERVLLEKQKVTLLAILGSTKFNEFYKSNNVRVIDFRRGGNHAAADRVRVSIKKGDVFHVQGMYIRLLRPFWKAYIKCSYRIITFWGSDLLRSPLSDKLRMLPFLYSANRIVVMNGDMYHNLRRLMIGQEKKIKILDFGHSTYAMIEDASREMSPADAKAYFGFEKNKRIIHVGYNACREQQHLEIMREVVKLPHELLEKMLFVFHFGYGATDRIYLDRLKNVLEKKNIQYVFIERFMDKREIAIFRLSADVFLYGQETDALSASVLEYLYAGAILIKPKWLNYSELRKRGVAYIEYERFEEIPAIVSRLDNKRLLPEAKLRNRKVLQRMSSWEVLAPKWKKLYEETSD